MKKTVVIILFGILVFIPGISFCGDFMLKTADGNHEVIKYKTYFYVAFDLGKPSNLTLDSKIALSKVEIGPESRHIPFSHNRNSVEIKIEKPGYFLVRINDSIKVFLFAENPEHLPEGGDAVDFGKIYHPDRTGNINETLKIQQALNEISGSGKILFFPPGMYKSGQLQIRSNSKIYLARGAEIIADTASMASFNATDDVKTKRFIYIGGAVNVEINGYGSINGNGRILRDTFGDDARMRLILAARSKNIRITGLTLKDPGSWNTHMLICEDVTLLKIKLLNDTELSNTDGFDPDAVRNFLIEDCFAICSDDNVAVKTTGSSGLLGNVYNVTIQGCVFLTKKSALKVGTETRGESMKNITFEDNDVLECDRGISIYVSDGTALDSIVYKNNRFGKNYPDAQQKAIHIIVGKRNPDSKLGTINNLMIKDCYFKYAFPKKSVIRYEGPGNGIKGTIENLIIEGKRVETPESDGIVVENGIIKMK